MEQQKKQVLKKRIVLLGKQGSGKTTLFNKLTGNNQPTAFQGQSLTRRIVQGFSQEGYGFEVVDTPGFESDEEQILHAAGIIGGLTYGPLNRVVLTVKVDRDKYIMDDIKLINKCVERFKQNVTIYFTKFDQYDDQTNGKQYLQKLVKDKFNFQSVLFGWKEKTQLSTIEEFDQLLLKSDQIDVELMESEKYSSFNFMKSLDHQKEIDLENLISKLEKLFLYTLTIINNYIDQLQVSEPQFLDILHNLQFFIRNQADKVILDFEKKYGDQMNSLFEVNEPNNQYILHIVFTKRINSKVQQILEKVEKRMREHQNYIFKYLKQCPNCDQIWMKVFGCDKVICGQKNCSKFETNLIVDYRTKIDFEIINDVAVCKMDEKNPLKNEDEVEKLLMEYYNTQLSQKLKDQLAIINFKRFIHILNSEIRNDFIQYVSTTLDIKDKEIFLNSLNKKITQLTQISPEERVIMKNIGCGKEFNWETEGKVLSDNAANQLISQGLIDYFQKEQNLITSESIIWKEKYNGHLNQSIIKQKSDLLVLEQVTQQKVIKLKKTQNSQIKNDNCY